MVAGQAEDISDAFDEVFLIFSWRFRCNDNTNGNRNRGKLVNELQPWF